MILVDTSVGIDHFHRGDCTLSELLLAEAVCLHPFVIGELAGGDMVNRSEILELLQALPQIKIADQREVLFFVERQNLYGQDLGYIASLCLPPARSKMFSFLPGIGA